MAEERDWLRLIAGTVLAGTMMLAVVMQLRAANDRTLESTALLAADSYLRALEAVRELYTSEVVGRLPEGEIPVTHDYLEVERAVPLPATFTMALAEHVGTVVEGLTVRLYSEYPFPWQGPPLMDEFERAALGFLTESPNEAFSAFEDREDGRYLRFARGDVMRAECVGCHNTHPDSPKTDWREGQLRGVLSISFPLESYQQNAAAARRPYEMLLLLALMGLAGALVMLYPQMPAARRARANGRGEKGSSATGEADDL